jgi:hypothetical protein
MEKSSKAITIHDTLVTSKIYIVRNKRIMLDRDLAELYEVETKVLNQAVRRNIERFPEEFMFHLTREEFEILRSQFVTSSWGGTRYLPMVFTEYGVAMLSSVLRSKRAIICWKLILLISAPKFICYHLKQTGICVLRPAFSS